MRTANDPCNARSLEGSCPANVANEPRAVAVLRRVGSICVLAGLRAAAWPSHCADFRSRRSTRPPSHDEVPGIGLSRAGASTKLPDVVARSREEGLPCRTHFGHDGILPVGVAFHPCSHGLSPISSSGVHKIGAEYPEARHTASIRGRSSAFAIWAKFHVSRKSIRWYAATAMCAASAAAFRGSGTPLISAAAKSATPSGMSRVGTPARNPDRVAAGRGSPALTSSITTCDTYRSNPARRVRHHV